ncbi:MAG: hypothetical protein A2033_12255 [Bacteroidetes bacterium GWA2_31_9]|nr:MAG: hypothetical protein A2033_12255 [Bacteroidetes bacterium GWA2_31_9]
MYKIIAYGDSIFSGKYTKYSEFKHVINYESNEKFLSLIDSSVPQMPNSLLVSDFNIDFPNQIEVTNSALFVGNIEFLKKSIPKYDSSIDLLKLNLESLVKNLNIISGNINIFNTKSYAFLIENNFLANFDTAFEKALIKTVKEGYDEIINKNIENGIKKIKGTGYGLTPSGDDFIAGLLFGLHINEILYQKKLLFLKNQIFEIAKSKNLYSTNFLYFAKEGLYFEYLKALIINLVSNDKTKTLGSLKKVLSYGESSGSDLLTGFYLCIKNKIGI